MSDDNTKQQKTDGSAQTLAEGALILKSSEPLPNEMLKIKKIYIIFIICIVLGIFIDSLFAIGLLGLMVWYTVDYHIVKVKRKVLRYMKFKLVEGVDNENMFTTMQPIFTGKYNMLVEKNGNGVMVVNNGDYSYGIIIGDDDTFSILWSISVGKALLPMNKYKSYRKILASMGIIAYEIQNAYHVQ